MDFLTAFLVALGIIGFIGIGTAIVIAYLLSRWYASLDSTSKAVVLAFFIVGGFVLIATLVGAGIGAVSILIGVFLSVFGALRGKRSE